MTLPPSQHCRALAAAFFVGLLGDAALQALAAGPMPNLAGLSPYFARHGVFEAMCIAAGIMWIATWAYLQLGLPWHPVPLFAYGAALDVVWWGLNLMPTLEDTYYAAMSGPLSALWGGIPMLLVYYAHAAVERASAY